MDRWHRLQNDLFRDALLSAYDIFVVAWLHAVFLYASRLFFFFFNGLLFFIDTSLDTLISAAAVGGFNLTGAEKKKKGNQCRRDNPCHFIILRNSWVPPPANKRERVGRQLCAFEQV